jgi:DNA-binding NarL/FixJ family response regulator
MRVVLVGSPAERDALRARLDGTIDIAAEFATLAAARAADVDADAILLPPPDRVPSSPFARARLGDETIDEPLTPREIQVIELLAEGLSNKAIAARLGISDQTVKFHLASILGKLGAANRTDAVRRAVRRGLVTL